MWHLKVPKIIHFYWGGSILPYVRFKTVESFIRLNPDWKVMFWYPTVSSSHITWETKELDYKVSCKDYLPVLMDLPIIKNTIDFDQIGFYNEVPENFKSDFIRTYLLSSYGGVWSDMDIIYIKAIDKLEVNIKENKDKDSFVCISDYGHSVGFLMSSEGSQFFHMMKCNIASEFKSNDYQCIGPKIYNKYCPFLLPSMVNIKMNAIYPHNATYVYEFFDGSKPHFADVTIGVHWYAGHPKWGQWLKETDGGLIKLGDCIIDNLIK